MCELDGRTEMDTYGKSDGRTDIEETNKNRCEKLLKSKEVAMTNVSIKNEKPSMNEDCQGKKSDITGEKTRRVIDK